MKTLTGSRHWAGSKSDDLCLIAQEKRLQLCSASFGMDSGSRGKGSFGLTCDQKLKRRPASTAWIFKPSIRTEPNCGTSLTVTLGVAK